MELLCEPPDVELQVFEEEARSALQSNNSPDVPFRLGLNPYRGCFHACAYCYARPTHEYLDFGAGTDFDRRLVVKQNLGEVLRQELSTTRRSPELVALSGVTDCYQPLEASYGITRECLQALADFRWPVGVITKGSLIERDIDVLTRARDRGGCRVWVSVPFDDDTDSRAIEPFASPSSRRIETIRRLAEAGLDVGVAVAPLIPGLNDHQVPGVLERARDAGATRAFAVLLRLPGSSASVFERRLREAFPDRAEKVLSILTAMRDGRRNDSRFGDRMRGRGARFDAVEQLFSIHCRRLGLEFRDEVGALRDVLKREIGPVQGSLFGSGGSTGPSPRTTD